MPIFPFFQYPYNINRFYPQNNIYSQKNHYNKTIDTEINNFNEDKTANNQILTNNTKNKKYNNQKFNDYNKTSSNQNKSSRYSGFGPIHFQNPFSLNSEEPIIEILGISLYLDDIIILGLLFFLYQEGVKDYMLFLALIMLLLS